MPKINFTVTHYERLKELSLEMLFKNEAITTRFNQVYTIVDLLHTTTIDSLNSLRTYLMDSIKKLENKDEWIADEYTQAKLATLRDKKELVNLIIGYKRYNLEIEANKRERAELENKLTQLKESQKTPEDRIKELEEQIAALDTVEEF